MRVNNNTSKLEKVFGAVEAVRLLARTGFDGIDWSLFGLWDENNAWNQPDWREKALEVRAEAERCGLSIVQAHAPFPSSGDTREFDDRAMAAILHAMEVASVMGAEHIVVHPRAQLKYRQYDKQLHAESVAFYRSLIPYCEKWNIRVCVENMWRHDRLRGGIIASVCGYPEDFCAMLDEINSPYITGCLDIGHCAVVGEDPAAFIRALGPQRLQALHVHDVDWRHDNHDMPFTQKLDWDSICQALAEIGYTGDLTFEAGNWMDKFPDALQEDANIMLCKVGRYLAGRIENGRKA